MLYTCYITGKHDHTIEVEASCEWVDNGIGYYEYWGACGNDVRMELEIEITDCWMVIPNGKMKRKINLPDEYYEDIEEQIRRTLE